MVRWRLSAWLFLAARAVRGETTSGDCDLARQEYMTFDNFSFVQTQLQMRQTEVPRADADFALAASSRAASRADTVSSWASWLVQGPGVGHGAIGLLGPPGRTALLSLGLAGSGAATWVNNASYSYEEPEHSWPPDWVIQEHPIAPEEAFRFFWLQPVLSMLIYVGLVCLVAFFYVPSRAGPPDDGLEHTISTTSHRWRYGPFSCLGDTGICCWTCWCAPIRWADTMRMLGLFSFWGAMAVWLGLALLDALTLGLVFWIALLCVQIFQRQKIRKIFDIDDSASSCVEDCLLYLLCPCCAICQEARQVELARAVGHPAVIV